MILYGELLGGISLRREYKSFDFVLLGLVLALCVFGAVMVYSAVFGHADWYLERNPRIAAIFPRHIVFLVTGIIVMLAAAFVDFRFICRFWIAFYIINLILLILVWYMGRNVEVERWLRLSDFGIPAPEWISIQPSEFTKIFSIIYLAMVVDKFKDRINEFKVLIPITIAAMIPIMLIVIQPSLSAGIVAFSIFACVLYMGKIRFMYIAIAFIVGGALIVLLYYELAAENPFFLRHLLPGGITENGIIREFQLDRIRPIFGIEVEADLLLQNERSLQAMMSGGLFGNGFMNTPVSVIVPHNDFIFAVIGAEFGFVGAMVVLAVMMAVVFKCLYIAHKTPFFYAKIIASSVGVMFAFQVFLNVAVVIGLMPNTGVTFPFISAGGSSMWINLASVGLVINIGMTKEKGMFE